MFPIFKTEMLVCQPKVNLGVKFFGDTNSPLGPENCRDCWSGVCMRTRTPLSIPVYDLHTTEI